MTTKNSLKLRKATKKDALALAELINLAGDGLPVFLWERMAEKGESVWDVGVRRANREEGGFSYRNALCLEKDNQVAACLIDYPIGDTPEEIDTETTPPLFVPLMELENKALDSWYINVLATYQNFQRQGLGLKLLEAAQKRADECGKARLSLIVDDSNLDAQRLYERFGFRQKASRPMVKEGWINPGKNWILMVK